MGDPRQKLAFWGSLEANKYVVARNTKSDLPVQADLRGCARFTSLTEVKPPKDSVQFISII
jgi:hypothetical protein